LAACGTEAQQIGILPIAMFYRGSFSAPLWRKWREFQRCWAPLAMAASTEFQTPVWVYSFVGRSA
jgi:hypothetical protein